MGWIALGILLLLVLTIAAVRWPQGPSIPHHVGPLSGDKVGAIDPSPTKPAGSVISCPNDHWLYRIKSEIAPGMVMRSANIERIEDMMPEPMSGTIIQIRCAYCGEAWRRQVGQRAQIHFTTGWWPKLEHKEPL